jgi:pimeloyl-ACP methyl ester carboxylesterase
MIKMIDMNTQTEDSYVLVHGGNMSTKTWNQLAKTKVFTSDGKMGGKVCNTIKPTLEHHHLAFAPTLLDEHSSTLTEHVDQISALILKNNLKNVVLVGHSYGGMVITGVAAGMPDRIKSMVYIDAAFPDPGQSLFDIIASGGCDPMSFDGLKAAAPYVEKLEYNPLKIENISKTYILCT